MHNRNLCAPLQTLANLVSTMKRHTAQTCRQVQLMAEFVPLHFTAMAGFTCFHFLSPYRCTRWSTKTHPFWVCSSDGGQHISGQRLKVQHLDNGRRVAGGRSRVAVNRDGQGARGLVCRVVRVIGDKHQLWERRNWIWRLFVWEDLEKYCYCESPPLSPP